MQPTVTDGVAWSVGLSVCHNLVSDIAIFVVKRDVKVQLSDMNLSPATIYEPI